MTWTVRDNDRDNEREAESRSEAEEMAATARELGSDDVEIIPPGDARAESDSYPVEACANCGEGVSIADARSGPGGKPVHEECPNQPATDGGTQSVEVVDEEAEPADLDALEQDLAERTVAEDPLNWMPGEFVDTIDGSEAINRKGFEVLGHFYGVDVSTEIVVPPEETGHEYCRAEAVATTEDGREVTAHGSAHTDRGDDSFLLLEMADTRARKRAISVATGAGAVAVEELRNEAGGANGGGEGAR